MTPNTRRLFLISCLALCAVLLGVLTTFSLLASAIHPLFIPYQFYLIGICVGALAVATIILAVEREKWAHYRVYFVTVLASAFLIVVINSIVFKVLDGEQFIRRLVRIIWVVFLSR